MRIRQGIILVLTVLFTICVKEILLRRAEVSFLKENVCDSAEFREQRISPGLSRKILKNDKISEEEIQLLTDTMLQGHFYPDEIRKGHQIFYQYKQKEYAEAYQGYRAIWKDIRFFPVAEEKVFYENSWQEQRLYQGERKHEGTDVFCEEDRSGYYPVVSMTEGKVEQKGWLTLGGYRIGIRSPGGGYFYYAHLSSYSREYQIGDTVKAGELLGFMGDTGYGTEGTTGKFPVHLHVGIYIKTQKKEELSVNPYWILKAFENKKLKIDKTKFF